MHVVALLSWLILFVSSSHSFNIIRLPCRCFWSLMAVAGVSCADSHGMEQPSLNRMVIT
jgi:hypothetical protein